MNYKNFAKSAAVAALALGWSFGAVQAAPVTIATTITTSSAITATKVNDIRFGTWLVIVRSTETPTLTMDNAGAVAKTGNTLSTLQNIVAAPGPGGLTVNVPVGSTNTILQMTRTAASAFTDPGMNVSAVSYSTAIEGNNKPFLAATAYPVTVVTGGTAEPVTLASAVNFTATPADGTYSSSFDVSFAY